MEEAVDISVLVQCEEVQMTVSQNPEVRDHSTSNETKEQCVAAKEGR
jgi:hypothetical protein